MRKRIIAPSTKPNAAICENWLEVESLTRIETTAEDLEYPVESVLTSDCKFRLARGRNR